MVISIQIPKNDKLLITKGQKVDFMTPFAVKKSSSTVRVPITEMLGVKPEKIYKLVQKTIGQEIKKDEVIAEEKNIFNSKKYISQIAGTLLGIDEVEGAIIIESSTSTDSEIMCHFFGEIIEIYDTYIELKVRNGHKVKTKNKVAHIGAPIFYEYSIGKIISEEDVQNKFLLARDIDPIDHAKIKTLGARGVISTKKNPELEVIQVLVEEDKDWENLSNKKFPFIISGPEENTIIFYE